MIKKGDKKPEQREILDRTFKSWEILPVPAEGWALSEMKYIVNTIRAPVFVSPIPAMMALMGSRKWSVFHNEHREKKELPNGRIISITAKTGWQLVVS